ncbi:MAG TPA: cysteine--tRNA ligase [Thermoanaerobaculia bacterium]|nr:cysteine--tRNA ligase [Thermoanaerobaculia bacterium]
MSELVLFNTMGRRLEELRPLVAGQVRIYGCGPTVYSDVHIGNLRTFLFQDLLRRALRYLGFAVTQVMNLTDVDDKTIQGARAAGLPLSDYTAPFIRSFMADLDSLHMERVEKYPRATEHIGDIVELVERLVRGGFAYESEGSVFFSIARDPDYGRLSGFDLDQVKRGERVASDEYGKEDVRDFVLWKAAKPGEPAWDSPWGPGRPGWHVECSAMSMKYLGETFDIHSGGVDLIFPHHENEIAQSESATGKPFVRIWLHAEHLVVDGQKMSKSLGNQYTLKDLLARGFSARALRYLFLSVHYRQKLNFTFEGLEGAAGALRRIDEMRFRLRHAVERAELPALADPSPPPAAAAVAALRRGFAAGLADDLNVSAALAALFAFVKEVNVAIEGERLVAGDKAAVDRALAEVDEVLGVLDAAAWAAAGARPAAGDGASRAAGGEPRRGGGEGGGGEGGDGTDDGEIERLVAERDGARKRRDFAAADRLRGELAARGIVVEDTPQGARWKRRQGG